MNKETVKLRPAVSEDMERVYEWQTESGIREFSRQHQKPSWQEHQAWFTRTLADSRRHLFIIEAEADGAVGSLRVDQASAQGLNGFEVSILVSRKAQHRGIGTAALRQLTGTTDFSPLLAFVKPENVASLTLFTRAGFKPCGDNWYVWQHD